VEESEKVKLVGEVFSKVTPALPRLTEPLASPVSTLHAPQVISASLATRMLLSEMLRNLLGDVLGKPKITYPGRWQSATM